MDVEARSPRPRLYEQLANQLRAAIEAGTLLPGDRLPSVRRLCQQHQVSVATAVHALGCLEAAGLLVARPKSGHYVRARRRPSEPRPVRLSPQVSTASVSSIIRSVYDQSSSGAGIDFGYVQTASGLLPGDRLGRMLVAVTRAAKYGGVEHEPVAGHLPLRQQIARRSLDWGCALSPDDLLITNGATSAIQLCLSAVARRGDTVAIESPSFLGILQLLEILALKALEIPCDPRYGMNLRSLENGLKRHRVAAVISATNFSNPLGSCMPDANKEALVAMLARREVPLIEDDANGDLPYGPTRPKVAKAFDRQGMVILCGSFSKTLAAGYRVGWLAAGRYRERIELLKLAQNEGAASVTQRAIAAFLESGGYDRHLRTLRHRLASSMQRASALVAEHFPPGTRMTRPKGGMALWLELPRRVSALKLYQLAAAEEIRIAPGPLFSARQELHHFIRLNTGVEWNDRVAAALVRLGQLARELAG